MTIIDILSFLIAAVLIYSIYKILKERKTGKEFKEIKSTYLFIASIIGMLILNIVNGFII